MIACREVRSSKARVGPEDGVDQTDALEEFLPVERGHQAHAGDHVADGHVHRRLLLVLDPDDLIDRCPLRRQAFLEPAQRRRDHRVLIAQPLDELDRKGRRQRGALEAPQDRCRWLELAAPKSEQAIRQRVGLLARRPSAHDPLRQAPEILDEHHPQGDRDRPEFADRQRLHALVGAHEPAERLRVKPAVRMGDERPGQPKDTRIALEVTLGQLWQLAVKAGGQVVTDLTQLFVHNVEIVDQPFGRRGDRALLADGLGNSPIRFEQHPPVVQHAWQQPTTLARRGRDALGGGKALGVLLKTLAAEEFRPNRFFELRKGNGL